MKEFTTKSGVALVIECADIKDVRQLKISILNELKNSGIKLPEGQTYNLKGMKGELGKGLIGSGIISNIFNIAVSLDTSEVVYQNVFKCLSRCRYNGERITEATFNDVEARADYYEVFARCIIENLMPFLKSLLSESLMTEIKQTMSTQESK